MPRYGGVHQARFREEAKKGKPVSASMSEMAEVVLPAQTNALGKLLPDRTSLAERFLPAGG